jgi:hypothetical protein
MHDSHKLLNIVEALEHLNGYFVIPVDGEELVVLRKEEFDKLKENKQEVQLELEDAVHEETVTPEENQEKIDLVNQELAMNQEKADYDIQEPEVELEEDEDLGAGPRTKVRFEPIKGDLSPELQE